MSTTLHSQSLNFDLLVTDGVILKAWLARKWENRGSSDTMTLLRKVFHSFDDDHMVGTKYGLDAPKDCDAGTWMGQQ